MSSKLHSMLAGAALAAFAAGAAAQWQPSKPITIIVPWAAGGSTDQVTRVTAAELEKALNQKVVIVNQPGASGSIGSKNALEAPKDGYTWTAGAARDLGTYKVLGMLDTQIQDWHLFLNVANTSVVGVNAGAPWKSMKELLDDMKAKPEQISVATAGLASAGHGTIEPITRTIPGFNEPPNYFGIFIPKGAPQEVVSTLERIWSEHIVRSEALKKYA